MLFAIPIPNPPHRTYSHTPLTEATEPVPLLVRLEASARGNARAPVGTAVGLVDGVEVGTLDGMAVGCEGGLVDGEAEGVEVGTLDGEEVGLDDGASEVVGEAVVDKVVGVE